jgi:hypothetical protein
MSLDTIVRSVTGRLNLREPQAESLRKLAQALESVPALAARYALSGADTRMGQPATENR